MGQICVNQGTEDWDRWQDFSPPCSERGGGGGVETERETERDTHTHLPLFWNFNSYFHLSRGISVAQLNCSYYMLIFPKSKMQRTSKSTVKRESLSVSDRLHKFSCTTPVLITHHFSHVCRVYKSHCQSVQSPAVGCRSAAAFPLC